MTRSEVAAAPTALFGETVLIRPPLNVELNDENPTMAVGVVSGGFISACEATVDRMTLLVFENDKTKSAEAFANEFVDDYLAKGGYTDGVKSEPIVDTNDDFDVSVEYPAAGGQPASTLYVAVRKRRGDLFAIVYQTRPGDYPVLKASFTKSAASLLVSPRRGCCRVCTVGKSCGDGCIASHLQCDQPRGCACDG